MEEIVIKGVTISDPGGPHHGTCQDIRIHKGVIQEIGTHLQVSTKTSIWEAQGSCVSMGWMDLQADFCDPGQEQKEGLENGAEAALYGGFAHVVLNTGQFPCADSKSAVTYLKSRSANFVTEVLPMAAISVNRDGNQLAEMYDLAAAGAIMYSDDGPLDRTEMLRRALEYAQGVDKRVAVCPLDMGLNAHATMHEGATSTHMGVVGNPTSSETMRIMRDLEVLRYAGGKLHFTVISSKESVELIRAAKKEGLDVTCATTAHHLWFIDEDLALFDGTLKVMPPFRTGADRKALIKGLRDGTIDALISDHRPEDLEHHDVEFTLAPWGMAGIESAYAVAQGAIQSDGSKDDSALVRALTAGPRHVVGYPVTHIDVDAPADVTWFMPHGAWLHAGISNGVNVPNYATKKGMTPTGQPLGVIRGQRSWRHKG